MSKPKNPVELVDRYLQAVRFWMPKSARQDDLIAELSDDLHSQIEAKEDELGRPLVAEEVSDILKRCGYPMIVGGSFAPQRFLIGPAMFPIYEFVMKMVLLWILVPVFVFIVGPTNVASSHEHWGVAVFNTFGQLWSGWFIAAGIITIVFVVLERTQVAAQAACKWDPMKLPPLQKQEKKRSSLQNVCELAFAIFGLLWLLLLPTYPVLILGPAAAFLKAAPLLHRFYIPILLLSAFSIVRLGLALARPQWTWFPKTAELVQALFTLILVNYMLDASGQMTNGEWHPFVVVADSVKNSTQYIKVAAIVNVSILLSLVGAWIGLTIAMIIQVWQLLRLFRRRSGAGQTAPLQVQ
jgi:hypothetical protein